jgi:hypothetical protein
MLSDPAALNRCAAGDLAFARSTASSARRRNVERHDRELNLPVCVVRLCEDVTECAFIRFPKVTLELWMLDGFGDGSQLSHSREHCQRVDNLSKSAKEAAGLWPWSPRFQNVLRKSFCSYHYEMFGSADRTAEYAGQDTRTLVKTYRRAVAHEEAEKFWVIYPG